MKFRLSFLFFPLAMTGLMFCLPGDGLPVQSKAVSGAGQLWLPVVERRTGQPPLPFVPDIPEWTQEGYDAQRTGYTAEEPKQPWSLLWTWNGPDEQGGAGGHFYHAPRQAHTVTGDQFVFVPAGSPGLYALRKIDGQQQWHLQVTAFNATPAYNPETRVVIAGGEDGWLYKIDGRSGQILSKYNAGNPLNRSVLLTGGYAYVVTNSGELHKVALSDMQRVWVYAAGSAATTPPTYSATRSLIVYATADLFVHAVRDGDGTFQWKVKPTVHDPPYPYTFDGYWPVVAEKHGVVFVRMNLGIDGMWSGPGANNQYPASNTQTRAFLEANPQWKNLFALDLDDGHEAFIPAVGYGGVETLIAGNPDLEVGPVPVVKLLDNGDEIAYQVFRSGQGNPPDGRWDSHLGEMVLDNQTISAMEAGDLRFVQFDDSYIHITDEQTPLTMAGDTIFNAHWGASESVRITDRSASRGLNIADPIRTLRQPTVIRRMAPSGPFDPQTHWTTAGLSLFQDTRYWSGPGWWVYWNVMDPPTQAGNAYSDGILPRYTYVSDGYIIVEGNGGDLFVMRSYPY